jgi:hypothetical protein
MLGAILTQLKFALLHLIKKMNVRNVFFICLIVSGLSSCNKDDPTITLSGRFNEISPISGRSQLQFTKHNILVKSETAGTYRDSFKYEIINNKIRLTPAWIEDGETFELEFWILDNSTFKIQNLYPDIPERPQSYMIYEK